MRSHLRILCAILLAGLTSGNFETPPTIKTSLNAGDSLTVQVLTYDDVVTTCTLKSPNNALGEIQFKPVSDNNDRIQIQPDTERSKCRALITVKEGDDGLWTLTSGSADGTERIQSYDLSVNPESDAVEHNQVDYLDNVFINTTIGSRHEITMPDFSFGGIKSCTLIMPTGQVLDVHDLKATGVIGIVRTETSSCSVSIGVPTDDFVGDWMLSSVGYRYSAEKIERHLPFTIHVEIIVDSHVDEVSVTEGNGFYIAVKDPDIHLTDTCRLLGPNKERPSAKYIRLDGGCRYKVFNVTMLDSGYWEIRFGRIRKIEYRAITHVTVHAASAPAQINLVWTRDRPVQEVLGPDRAVYCRIRSPEGYVVYDRFGRCWISLNRVIKHKHEGIWKMEVGMPGQVLTDSYTVNVTVVEAVPKPRITTSVKGDSPDDIYMKNMYLSCYLESPEPINFCKFRDPSGRILIAAEAVGQSRYSWHGTGTNYTGGIHAHECGIRITNTTLSDFGIWRCEIDTRHVTYYGFLTAKALWIRDPEIAASITTVPTLTADRSWISSLTDESVTMTCSIQAPIRYCYFRARNGTLFNVAPSKSHDLATYVGAGLDAGECGIKFLSLATSDSGYWSCHVGLLDPNKQEQLARFEVTINDTMVVSQRGPSRDDNRLILEGQVNNARPLEYCRFVRIDGFGFTENMPSNILNRSYLSKGLCAITISYPTSLDQHPWAIVAKIRGQDTEMTRFTDIAFPVPNPPGGGSVHFRLPGAWIIVMTLGICMILLASFVGPKRNREWTYARANALRNSFVAKKVEQNTNDASKNTAVAA
ncbi:uncharacterized protein [Maniola hyperantus]|uniref:uncharacterized protein n=1 Tax=Aphantopus hyperantus TaxID=2795564 RepID=UPI0015691787|nr:uncharacterized protein LOC117992272 [Maniola hyperantus]XP_034835826.1 uncharacterized protein LOC117992272 [Maniola hyperantus]